MPFLLGARHQPNRLKGSQALLAKQAVELEHCERRDGELSARGWVRGESGHYPTALRVDAHSHLQEGRCACPWIDQHELSAAFALFGLGLVSLSFARRPWRT